jgi:hypothetical protein
MNKTRLIGRIFERLCALEGIVCFILFKWAVGDLGQRKGVKDNCLVMRFLVHKVSSKDLVLLF